MQKQKVKVMQENEFEKQVKTTIDGFRLRPSEPVWPNIWEEIRDKKRRRILLLIPVLLGLMVLGYFTRHSFYGANKTHTSQQNILLNNNTKSKDGDDKSLRRNQTDVISPEKGPVFPEKPGDESSVAPVKKNVLSNDNKDKNISGHKVSLTETGSPDLKKKISDKKNSHIAAIEEKQKHKIVAREKKESVPFLRKIDIKNNLMDVQKNQNQFNSTDTEVYIDDKLLRDNIPVMIDYNLALYAPLNSIAANKLILKEIPPVKSEPDLKRRSKLKWGFDFAVGGSSRFDRSFKFGSTEKRAANTVDLLGSPVTTGTAGNVTGGGLLILPPSVVKVGTAFKAGIVIDKSISKRINISTGLRYVYASDRIAIGKAIYSTGNLTLLYRDYLANAVAQASYSGVQPQNYTNKYHFVELPVSVNFNITGKWKIPVIWNAGVSVSRLIASNVLLYDVAWGGLYYQGKNELSKTQFSAATGFSIRFKGNNQWQWNIGPQISMNTTKLFRSTSDKNKHLVYGGINLQLLFPGKKR